MSASALLALLLATAPFHGATALPQRSWGQRGAATISERPQPAFLGLSDLRLRATARAGADAVRHVVVWAKASDGGLAAKDAPVVVANFTDSAGQPSGFGQLRVWSNPNLPSTTQLLAAGYAEVS
jgi:hypothetical protein